MYSCYRTDATATLECSLEGFRQCYIFSDFLSALKCQATHGTVTEGLITTDITRHLPTHYSPCSDSRPIHSQPVPTPLRMPPLPKSEPKAGPSLFTPPVSPRQPVCSPRASSAKPSSRVQSPWQILQRGSGGITLNISVSNNSKFQSC